VELRQVFNDENSVDSSETPTKNPNDMEQLHVSGRKNRAPLGDIMVSMNTLSSGTKQTIRKPRYDERVASATGS
jgi:hypothetical protein